MLRWAWEHPFRMLTVAMVPSSFTTIPLPSLRSFCALFLMCLNAHWGTQMSHKPLPGHTSALAVLPSSCTNQSIKLAPQSVNQSIKLTCTSLQCMSLTKSEWASEMRTEALMSASKLPSHLYVCMYLFLSRTPP
jgi:hypothetical protein